MFTGLQLYEMWVESGEIVFNDKESEGEGEEEGNRREERNRAEGDSKIESGGTER